MHTSANDPDNHDLCEENIRTALEKLLGDRRLHMSQRNRRFLRFVVEEKLAGRAERIKSYTIAVDVFGRAPTFDGLTDPIVRIEATRLRAALDAFYQGPGAGNPLIIELPKGGYVPQFRCSGTSRSELPSRRAKPFVEARSLSSWRTIVLSGLAGSAVLGAVVVAAILGPWKVGPDEPPIIALEPVQSISGTGRESGLAQGLTQSIISRLSSSSGMRVVHLREGRASADPAAGDSTIQVYRLESNLRMTDAALRFWWSVIDARSGRTLWSEIIDQPRQGETDSTIEDEIAARVTERILRHNGTSRLQNSGPGESRPRR